MGFPPLVLSWTVRWQVLLRVGEWTVFFTFVVFFAVVLVFFVCSCFFCFLGDGSVAVGPIWAVVFFGGGSSFSLAASTVVRLFLGNSNARECIVLLVLCH